MLKTKYASKVLNSTKLTESIVKRLMMISHKRFSDSILKKYEVKETK